MRNRRRHIAAKRRYRPARRSLVDLLASMPDVGLDSDFARVDVLEIAGRELTYQVFAEGNLWVARCPDPELASDGPSREQAVDQLREALELRLGA